MHDVLRFWLDRGVDGFRIDVIHRIAKDPLLRDNPPSERPGPGLRRPAPRPRREPRRRARVPARDPRRARRVPRAHDGRRDRSAHPDDVAKYYGRGDELHLAFNFTFLRSPWDAEAFAREIARFDGIVPLEGWPDYVLSNHDVAASRVALRRSRARRGARARGGAAAADAARHAVPLLRRGDRHAQRRDSARALPGSARAHAAPQALARSRAHADAVERGSRVRASRRGEPWLPIAADAATRNVDAQRADRASLLWLYKELLALRRATPALEQRRVPRGSTRSRACSPTSDTRELAGAGGAELHAARLLAGSAERARDRRACARAPARRFRPTPRSSSSAPSEAAVLVVDGLSPKRRGRVRRLHRAAHAARPGREHGAVAVRARRRGRRGRRACPAVRSCRAGPSSGARSCARASASSRAPSPSPSERTDYFALCLAAHFASAATYVPTDVDTKIRRALWHEAVGTDELARMRALALGLALWDMRAVSARIVFGRGHRAGLGPRRRAALGAVRRTGRVARGRRRARRARARSTRSTPSSRARRARSHRVARARGARARAAAARGDPHAQRRRRDAGARGRRGSPARRGAAREVRRARARALRALRRRVRPRGRAVPRAARERGPPQLPAAQAARAAPRRELLLPIAPCPRRLGRAHRDVRPRSTTADRAEIVAALVEGCRKVPGQAGYARALAGFARAYPRGLEAPELAPHHPASVQARACATRSCARRSPSSASRSRRAWRSARARSLTSGPSSVATTRSSQNAATTPASSSSASACALSVNALPQSVAGICATLSELSST